MSVTKIDSTSTGSASFQTSRAIPVPVGAAALDVVVVRLSRWESINPAVTKPGAEWILRAQAVNGSGKIDTFLKRLTAGDTGTYTFSWTGSMWSTGQATLYRGVSPTADLSSNTDFPLTFTTNSGLAFPTVTLNGVRNGSVLDWHGYSEQPTTHTPPTSHGGFTEIEDDDSDTAAYLGVSSAGNYSATGATTGLSGPNISSLLELPAPAVTRVNTSSISTASTGAGSYGVAIGVACNVGDLIVATMTSDGTHVTNGMAVLETTNFQTFTTIAETQMGDASSRWIQTFFLVNATPLSGTEIIEADQYASATNTSLAVDVFRGTTGLISKAVTMASVAASVAAYTPALGSAPDAGDLVLTLVGTASSTGTKIQPPAYLLGSRQTAITYTGHGYVLSADGSSTYQGSWTWSTTGPSALQTVAFGLEGGGGGEPPPDVELPVIGGIARSGMVLGPN